MNAYRVLEHVTDINKLDAGDLCKLKLPGGRIVEGVMLTRAISLGGDDGSVSDLLRMVWFNDGRSYPVSLEDWPSFCRFVEGWHNPDNDMRKEQS